MENINIFFSNLHRIYAVVPTSLRHSIRWLFIGMILLSFMELLSITALAAFFSSMGNPERFFQSPLIQILVSFFPQLQPQCFADPRQLLLWFSLLPISIIILKNILSAIIAWSSAMLGERVAADIGNRIMEQFLYMSYDWHLSAQSSQALTAMQWRFNLGQMLLQTLTAWSNLISICVLFCGLLVYEPGVTAYAICFIAIIALLTYRLLRRRVDRASHVAALAQQKENNANMVAISGVRELIIYQKQETFLDSIRTNVVAGMKPRSFLGISATIPTWTMESAGFFFIFMVTWFLIRFQEAPMPVITEMIFLIALTAWRVLPSLNRVLGASVMVRALQSTALPCILYLEELSSQAKVYKALPTKNFSIMHDITFDHVSYRYPGADKDALHDICCQIPRGSTIGLIGRSGAGKSTFINILSGLLQPTEGRILVDGKELSAEDLAAYRRRIGYVPQHPYLLSGSIAQNVAFSDWGNEPDIANVRAACREAAIDFLGRDCEDIDHQVNANGSGLSGGQIQRVSIARALYTKPDLLIFDEATSALDQSAEAEVQQAMQQSKGKRINVIAAHRLTTLNICDSIIWLETGRIRTKGNAEIILKTYATEVEASSTTA